MHEVAIKFSSDAAIGCFAINLAKQFGQYASSEKLAQEARAMVAECGMATYAGELDADLAAAAAMETSGAVIVEYNR